MQTENPVYEEISEVLRHETQWQTADLEGSPDTLYRTLPQKHPPSWGPPLIPAPLSPPATIVNTAGQHFSPSAFQQYADPL